MRRILLKSFAPVKRHDEGGESGIDFPVGAGWQEESIGNSLRHHHTEIGFPHDLRQREKMRGGKLDPLVHAKQPHDGHGFRMRAYHRYEVDLGDLRHWMFASQQDDVTIAYQLHALASHDIRQEADGEIDMAGVESGNA